MLAFYLFEKQFILLVCVCRLNLATTFMFLSFVFRSLHSSELNFDELGHLCYCRIPWRPFVSKAPYCLVLWLTWLTKGEVLELMIFLEGHNIHFAFLKHCAFRQNSELKKILAFNLNHSASKWNAVNVNYYIVRWKLYLKISNSSDQRFN